MQRKNGKTEKMKTHKFERGEESKNSKEREGSKRAKQDLMHGTLVNLFFHGKRLDLSTTEILDICYMIKVAG